MIDYLTSAAILVQIAFIFYSLGFLARDELWLRCLLLTGTTFYLFYYYILRVLNDPNKLLMFAGK